MLFFNTSADHGSVWTTLAQLFHSYSVLVAFALTVVVLQLERSFRRIVTAWPFFTRRYAFLKSKLEQSGRNVFKFDVLHVRDLSRTVPT